MNIDLSVYRMAARETDSLLLRHMLVAHKRAELDITLASTREEDATVPAGEGLEDAIRALEDRSEQIARDFARLVDMRV